MTFADLDSILFYEPLLLKPRTNVKNRPTALDANTSKVAQMGGDAITHQQRDGPNEAFMERDLIEVVDMTALPQKYCEGPGAGAKGTFSSLIHKWYLMSLGNSNGAVECSLDSICDDDNDDDNNNQEDGDNEFPTIEELLCISGEKKEL